MIGIGIENYFLKKELQISIDKYEVMHHELEEINHILALEESSELVESSYHSWEDSKKLAKKFHIDSNGKFSKEWGLFLSEKAKEYSINPYILFELIKVETGGTFKPDTVGPKTKYGRAYGLAQFMENTGPWIANMADLPYEKELLYNPYYSMELVVVYLDFLFKRYGDWDHTLTAYHRGMYGLEKFINNRGHSKSWYSEEIQENAKKLEMVVFNQ
jgi:hypothetical protein